MNEPDCSQQAYAEERHDHDLRQLQADYDELKARLAELEVCTDAGREHTLRKRAEARLAKAEAVLLRRGLLACDDCDEWFTPQMLPIHKCAADSAPAALCPDHGDTHFEGCQGCSASPANECGHPSSILQPDGRWKCEWCGAMHTETVDGVKP